MFNPSLLLPLLVTVSAHAGDFKLPAKCSTKLQARAVKAEKERMSALHERLVSKKFEVRTSLSYYPNGDKVTVHVSLEDPADGRYAPYAATVLKTEALACKVELERRHGQACRYSRHEGPESLNEIHGLKYEAGDDIAPESKLSKARTRQVRAFLTTEGGDPDASLADLIRGTDDQKLSSGTLTLPNGTRLDYLGAYGGDNPYGIFFKTDSTTVAGNNGDGSVCIK